MSLGKFKAGRIYQIRAQKSYLAAHPFWFRASEPKYYLRCGNEDETFSHAILDCPSTGDKRKRLLEGLADVGPDSPLRTSKPLLLALASLIMATGTNVPPDMFPSLPPSPTSMVPPSSPIAPARDIFASSPPCPI